MKSRFFRALVVCAAFSALFIHQSDTARAVSSGIVISQVYGAGGNAGSTLKNDFIELYNLGSTPVSVTGWSVQYASSTGSNWSATPLTGVIEPHTYYLIQESSGGPNGTVNLPTPNATGTLAMAAGAGKVALLTTTAVIAAGTTCPSGASVVDVVGYGTGTTCFEGTGPTAPTTVTNAAFRKNDGAQDTDNNAADFVVALANPRNSPQNTAPTGILSATPLSAAAGATVLLAVTVTPGTNPTSTGITVKGNLLAIGGSAAQDFAQDPVDSNKFTFTATIGAAVTSGAKTVSAMIADTQGRSSTAQTTVTVTAATDTAPAVTSTNPVNSATNVPVDANIVIGFSESVTATASAFSIQCPSGSPQAFTQSASPNSSFTLNPTVDLPYATTCTAKVTASQVTDTDTNDPPDTLTADVTFTFTTENAPVQSNSFVVISQVYGGGGNGGPPVATYQNDYVELYNRGTATVDIGGWSLQYASATGSGWDSQKLPLGGTIAPGQYYLIKLASSGDIGAVLPVTASISGSINMAAAAGKIALVDSFDGLVGTCPIDDEHLMDFVGYGTTANCQEGATRAPAPSNTTAIFRLGDGSIDTDRNGSDFVTGTPAPRSTAPVAGGGGGGGGGAVGLAVLSTDPASNRVNVPRDATIGVTFTEPVAVFDPWFDITCANTGQHNDATFAGTGQFHYITPNVNFLAGESCTVTLYKDQISSTGVTTDTMSLNYVWSFTVATGTAPPYPPSVHLTMGNPSGAVASLSQPNNYLMEKDEFALSYNRDFGRPNWVSWHLSDDWTCCLVRVDTFRADPGVPPDWYRVQGFDFSGSGFDRGHMTPNADRNKGTSIPINQATFLMSNMVAQAPDNNQGPWASLESYLRTLLPANEIYIVAGATGTGGTGSNGFMTTIASSHVNVPAYTWKVALVLPKGENDLARVTCTTRTIAVIMPNAQGIRSVPWDSAQFLTTIDAVETLTHYDFFSNLPEPIQRCVEAGTNGTNPDLVPGNQTITFGPLDPRTFGDADFTVSATASSGLPVSLSIESGPATISGGTVHLTGVGTVKVLAAQPGNGIYNPAQDVEQSFEVAKAGATIVVTGYSGAYDGAAHGATGTATGVGDEDLTGLLHLGATFTNASSATAHWTFDGNANYVPASGDVTITITTKGATITAADNSKTYGSADPALATSSTGFLPADGITVNASRAAGDTFGTYLITPAAAGAALGNYDVSVVTGTFSIGKKAATVTAGSGTKVYGTPDPTLTPTSAGFVPADGIIVTETARDAGDNVGSYATHATASGAALANYSVTSVEGSLAITPSPVTITAGAKSKMYGDADPPLTYQMTSGSLVTGDSFSGSLTRVAGEAVGTYAILQGSVALSGNYTLSYVGATLTIGGAFGNKADALAQMRTLRATVADKEDGKKLDEAIDRLADSLNPALWRIPADGVRLDARDGEKAIELEKQSVEKLEELIKSKKSTLPDAVLQEFVTRITAMDRLLAAVAIADAQAAGGDAGKIQEALKKLQQGDAQAAEGKRHEGIDQYKDAWKQAQEALKKA